MFRKWNRVVAALLLLATIHPVEGLAGPYEDGDQAFRKKNYEAALRYWHPMAFAGHSGAQLGVATLYYGGHGVMLDYNVAFDWYSKAADQGVPQAQYMLAAMYRDGKGVEQKTHLRRLQDLIGDELISRDVVRLRLDATLEQHVRLGKRIHSL